MVGIKETEEWVDQISKSAVYRACCLSEQSNVWIQVRFDILCCVDQKIQCQNGVCTSYNVEDYLLSK